MIAVFDKTSELITIIESTIKSINQLVAAEIKKKRKYDIHALTWVHFTELKQEKF